MSTDNYTAASSLSAYFPNRTSRQMARLWANEKFLHDAADVGILEFFEGPGPNPTTLPGYDAEKIWLRTTSGVTSTKGDVLVYSGTGSLSDEDNWTPLTPAKYVAYLSSVVTRYVDTRDFGAVADGTDHLLSSEYATLAAAQAVYPRATSLSQSIDAMAIQKAIDTVGAAGGGTVNLGGGSHYCNSSSQIFVEYNNVVINGNGLKIISNGAAHPVFVTGSFTDDTKRADDVWWVNINFVQTATLVNPPNTTWYPSGSDGAITDNHTSAAILIGKSDRTRVIWCSFTNYLYGIQCLSDWEDYTVQSEGNRWENLTFDGCNFGIFTLGAVKETTIRNILNKNASCLIEFIDDGAADPPHAVYIAGGRLQSAISQDVTIDSVIDEDNPHILGSCVKLKSVDGFSITNVLARNATGGVDALGCQNGIIDQCMHSELITDANVTVSQGAVTLWGCTDVLVAGVSINMTGAGTQGIALRSLAKSAYATPPSTDVPCTRVVVDRPVIKYNPSGSSPLSAIYWEDCVDCHLKEPTIWRIAVQDQYMINVQKSSSDITPTRTIISYPTIIADASDANRHKTVIVDSGVEACRVLVDSSRVINVDDRNASFVSDSGTDTILERALTFGNSGKARSGRTWNFISTHVGAVENSADAIFDIIAGNANKSVCRFSDIDNSGIGRIEYDHSTNAYDFYTNGGLKLRISGSGVDLTTGSIAIELRQNGVSKLDSSGGFRMQTDTATNIASATATVNTANKVTGKTVYDTTNGRIMIANGSAATSTWSVADGSATVTPS